MKKQIENLIEELLRYAEDNLDMLYENKVFLRNQLLDLFKIDAPAAQQASSYRPLQEFINDMVDYAIKNKLCQKEEALLFETRIIGIVMPTPYQVITHFEDIATDDVEAATKYLNTLSVNSNYIRSCDIDKNIKWEAEGDIGNIQITINLSKPEKDPKEIAALKKAPQTGYPKCALCAENVGFAGSLTKAPRQTLRTIPIELNQEKWHFQFSPYVYFQNHCIALSEEHRPMTVNLDTFKRLFDFIELFPFYFIGSNAALPIVGGSILSHDHYQGGSKVLPALKAPIRKNYVHQSFLNVKIAITDWYNSVIRLESPSREDILEAIKHIIEEWFNYTDKSVGIIAKTSEQHNAITPIARFDDCNNYVVDLILRNNRTDKEHPFGIFHPTEDLHNIKKEGIGIIEAMGLFILPGRLSTEAYSIRDYLTGKSPVNFAEIAEPKHPMSKHLGMIMQLVNDYGTSVEESLAEKYVIEYINKACIKILETTAVFKNDDLGQAAFNAFLESCGCSNLD